jgi:hypothetical protein
MSHDEARRATPGNRKAAVRLIGRPRRQKVIGKEDLLNLTIALETSRDVEDFVDQMWRLP